MTVASPSQMPTPMPTSTPSTATFDTSSLPVGWNNASNSSSTESTTILALAIVLAGSICVFILGCLVWRRRKKRARDIERKLAHPVHDNSSGDMQEQGPRSKMRMWARASARWKSNIRQSARRRRKRLLTSCAANRPPSPTLDDSQMSVIAPSSTSRRSSLSAEGPDPSPATALHPDDSSTGQADSSRPPSPPTYGASFVPRLDNAPSTPAMCNPISAPPPDRPRSTRPSNQLSPIDDEPLPYIPCGDGHIAMDDKSHLARIQDLASSPPATQVSESAIQSVSAPEWQEVEDDLDLGIDLSDVPMAVRDFGFLPSFPPPPKAGVSFGYLDDHPLHYGNADDILVPPIPGPSRSPSAPPIDYPSLEPSAPSMEDDDLFQDWDAASSYVHEAPTSSDQDSTPACATDPSMPPPVSFTSRSSLTPVRQTATRNSILPRYHP